MFERKFAGDTTSHSGKSIARYAGRRDVLSGAVLQSATAQATQAAIGRGYLCLIEEHSKFVSAGRAEVFGIQT
jgi:hypothetical protein